jgi:pantoate--beta-alanine ligase
LMLVRRMVEAFFVPTAIVGCPTVREADGLAMSSRNRRLPPADRARASRLYEALRTPDRPQSIASALAADGFEVDYVEDWENRRVAAVRLGGVRLIDNVPLQDAS